MAQLKKKGIRKKRAVKSKKTAKKVASHVLRKMDHELRSDIKAILDKLARSIVFVDKKKLITILVAGKKVQFKPSQIIKPLKQPALMRRINKKNKSRK